MTGRRDVDEELRARLHEAAGAHEPDRARMLARIERGMAGRDLAGRRAARPPALGWARVAGATAAVAGVLVVGGYAVASAVKDEAPARRSVAASPTASPSPAAPTSPAPRPSSSVAPTPGTSAGTRGPDRPSSSGTPDGTPAGSPSGTATGAARPPAAGTEDGPLWSDGSVDPHSNDYWAQSNITLRTSTPLTALTVELRVAQTGGVASTGAWRSLPEDDFTFTVEERDGFLVHRWTLKQGRTVPAGEWMFAGQYDHALGGRDANGDRYSATATAQTGRLSVRGDFAPHDDGA
ncbi:hypothetical protein AB0E77_27065 [Streptomyces sp. NPDC032940]|uniref:hypothetical protein n=1 Tax=Streptomyces sp. NPDC032940 TaxID=3155366 RepID=UPI0033F712A6